MAVAVVSIALLREPVTPHISMGAFGLSILHPWIHLSPLLECPLGFLHALGGFFLKGDEVFKRNSSLPSNCTI